MDNLFSNQRTVVLVRSFGIRMVFGLSRPTPKCPPMTPIYRHPLAHDPSIVSLFGAVLVSLCSRKGSFIKDPWLVVVEFQKEICNLNMFVYYFRTSHMIFTKNEHVKLNETCKHTKGCFMANLEHLDLLGRLTYNLCQP